MNNFVNISLCITLVSPQCQTFGKLGVKSLGLEGIMRKTFTLIDCREHAEELGNSVPKTPMVFLKPTSSYLVSGDIELMKSSIVHHEGIIDLYFLCS